MHTLTYRPATPEETAAHAAGETHRFPWLRNARATDNGLEVPTLPPNFDWDWDHWDHCYPEARSEVIMGADRRFYRVVIEQSMYPDAPDYDGTCPVYAARPNGYGGFRLDSEPVLGTREQDGLLDNAPAVFDYFAIQLPEHDAWEVFDRYLRIFYGGSAEVWDAPDGLKYLAYDTRALRESWGLTDERLETSAPSFGDWKAYVEGEVYWIRVEESTDGGETWGAVDNGGDAAGTGDIFGREYALEGALELLMGVLLDVEAEVGMTELPLQWTEA